MWKIWTIAKREYGAMVATKAFLLSITLMPVLMFGSIILASWLGKSGGDQSDRRIVVADGTGGAMFEDLQQAAQARNESLSPDADVTPQAEDQPPRGPLYVLQRYESDSLDDEDRLSLSSRARAGEIKAFVEIPSGLLSGGDQEVRLYGPGAMFSEERDWLESAVNNAVRLRRLKALDLDPAVVGKATAHVPVAARGLVKELSGGRVGGADERNNIAAFFVPFGFMMLMFMVLMLSAQPLLESVMEEKSGRIAEVLLGSVNTFQLMLGKLLGNVAGSLSVVAIYAVGGYAAAYAKGWTDFIPWDLAPWFLAYQVLAVLLFSSIFMAVGAAVTQLKEAQSMLLPVWLLICMPMFVWLQIAREPNGKIATALSFFPPSAPLVMVLRLGSEEAVPMWHVAGSLAVLMAATAACTYVAGRVFRIGILWQGKTPKLHEIARWAWRG